MKEIEDSNLILDAAEHMSIYSKRYCMSIVCNHKRMRAAENETNCEWYHGAWMYCRLANIVVSEDYLGDYYQRFFEKRFNQEVMRILICGMADYATFAHVLRRIPNNYPGMVQFVLLDICKSPLLLCKWYLSKMFPEFRGKVELVTADATNIPFENETFDLITTYSFLTRMIYYDAEKVAKEWIRLLKRGGEILTTVHVTNDNTKEGKFYRSENADILYAMAKVEETIQKYGLASDIALVMRDKVKRYLVNIMSVAMSEENLARLFNSIACSFTRFEQPGELESIHNMLLVHAVKNNMKR